MLYLDNAAFTSPTRLHNVTKRGNCGQFSSSMGHIKIRLLYFVLFSVALLFFLICSLYFSSWVSSCLNINSRTRSNWTFSKEIPMADAKSNQGAVSIRKTVLPGMAIPMLKIRRPNGRLIFNMGIPIPGKDGLYIEMGPRPSSWITHQLTIYSWQSIYLCYNERLHCGKILLHYYIPKNVYDKAKY